MTTECDNPPRKNTPLTCLWCDEVVLPGERIAPLMNGIEHFECGLRAAVGGINHQLGKCSCCGGTEPPDPPGMTLREAAKAAFDLWDRTTRDKPWRAVETS